jgi:hypothetical protein
MSIRLIHAAQIAGVVLFALVSHFVLRPSMAGSPTLPAFVPALLVGLSLAALGSSFLLGKRIPRRSSEESASLYWATAATPALLTWTPLEAAGLLGVFVYALTGSPAVLGIAAVAVICMAILNPGYLERR